MQPQGIISAIITPFSQDGETINEKTLRQLIESGIASGLNGIVPCGGTGEFATLSFTERQKIVEISIEQAAGRMAIMAQTGANSTREAVLHAKHAASMGAHAIMPATPYYETIDFDSIRRYFHDIASATDLPICLYNFPAAMGVYYNIERIQILMEEIPSIRFIKDSSADFALLDCLVNEGLGIKVFVGEDILTFPAFLQGCEGVINGTANFLAPAFVQMLMASKTGQTDQLMTIWRQINPLISAIIGSGHYNGAVKAATAALGFDVGAIRAPYNILSQTKIAHIQALVRQVDGNLLNKPPM